MDSEARKVDSDLFKIKTNDAEFKPMENRDTLGILGDKNLLLEKVNPQMSRKGEVVFEVPSDLKKLIQIYRGKKQKIICYFGP